jgi:hypothetical protein
MAIKAINACMREGYYRPIKTFKPNKAKSHIGLKILLNA